MPKNVSAQVLANQAKRVATQATLLKIQRTDGITYRLTNHDADIEYAGEIYTHNVPFVLSAISTGSQFSVDNTDLTLALDGEVFKLADFERRAFAHADVEIIEVDYTAPQDGGMILRKGWFGPLELGQYGVAKITIVGLLKLFDIEVGRLYQPSCDADLGDKRCKVAINYNQMRDHRETLRTGDWRYVFNPSLANAITLANPSFEEDAPITDHTAPIPGWTKSQSDAYFIVSNGGSLPNATDGSYYLHGRTTGPGAGDTKLEAHFYQDVDLISAGIDDDDIDEGRISLACFADFMQTAHLQDPVRLQCTLFDENDEIIYSHDTRYTRAADVHEVWRTKPLVFPVFSGTRKVRIILSFSKEEGTTFNAAVDNVRLYWWDHIDGSPWDDVIHKVVRIANRSSELYAKYPVNNGFELANAAINTADNITGWVKGSGHPWGTDDDVLGYGTPPEGIRLVRPGDNLSGVQSTYELSTTIDLVNGWNFSTTKIDLGFIIGELFYSIVWGDTESAASVVLEFYDETPTLITTNTILDFETRAAQSSENLSSAFVVPVGARTMRIILYARSPASGSQAYIGFDNIYAGMVDASIIDSKDATSGTGSASTVFSTTSGSYTFDGALVWQAFAHHVQFDVVSAVTDRKLFFGTDIAGEEGAYETGQILWISGQNRGQRNLIRVWDSDTKGIKLYFESVNPIQVGDRFQYIRSCQKRFVEDCLLRYNNGINFRGIPHLPGRISD